MLRPGHLSGFRILVSALELAAEARRASDTRWIGELYPAQQCTGAPSPDQVQISIPPAPFNSMRPSDAQSNTAKISQRSVASALVELWRVELTIRLGLGAAHEEAFLDDLTVPDRVKPDLIEVHAFLALGRDL